MAQTKTVPLKGGKKLPKESGLFKEKRKKPYRFRPGTRSLKEIRQYQKTTDFLVKKLPFQRLIREKGRDIKPDLRMTKTTLEAIQDGCENFLVQLLEDTSWATVHAKRVTACPDDMRLALRLRRTSSS